MTERSALAECHPNGPPPPSTSRYPPPPPSTSRDPPPLPSTSRDPSPPPSTSQDPPPPPWTSQYPPPPPSTSRDPHPSGPLTLPLLPPTLPEAHIYDSVSLDESFSSLPPPLHQSELDDPLLLNLTVDENSKRLERLEAALARLEESDTNKARRIEQLEATVARLEASLNQMVCHNEPRSLAYTPGPPQHLPPPVSHSEPKSLVYTPAPPKHPPPPPVSPTPPQHQAPLPVTPTLPRAPHHPPQGRLLSACISKSSLTPVDCVIQYYRDYIGKEGKMGTLAVVLARESFFGEEVMSKCTARGYGDKPGYQS